MECTIGKTKVKLFAKTLQCMNKIGEELSIQVCPDRLNLSALNPAKSAFILFALKQSFFERLAVSSDTGCIKVPLKSLLIIFKSIATIEAAHITLDKDDAKLIVKLDAAHGMKKTYNLNYEEVESSHAIYNKDEYPCRITIGSKQFTEYVSNFHNNVQEITFTLEEDEILLKSYSDESELKAGLSTDLKMKTITLEGFEMTSQATNIRNILATFCLKDLKAFLAFGEAFQISIRMYFGGSGIPVLFSAHGDEITKDMEADLVLAVVQSTEEETSSQTSSAAKSSARTSTQHDSISSFTQVSGAASLHSRHSEGRAMDPSPRYEFEGVANSSAFDDTTVYGTPVQPDTEMMIVDTPRSKRTIEHVYEEEEDVDYIEASPPRKRGRYS